MPALMQSFLTPEEVAKQLRVPERTIMRWLRDSYLPGVKLGKEWRIDPQELEEFIRTHRNIRDQQKE